MPSYRFFSQSQLAVGELLLVDEEAHHLSQVMRARAGDIVEVADGKGNLSNASITEIGKKQVRLNIEEITTEPKPLYTLTLALGLQRAAHLEYALEKCTELGVTDFILFAANRSERKELTPNNIKRYESIIQAALKQSGRLYLPTITFAPTLQKAITNQPCVVFGDLSEKSISLNSASLPQSVCVVIGPESGLSEKEDEILRKEGAIGIRFHPNILRAETAAIIATYAVFTKIKN